jgi:hypothetical protein
MPRYYFHSQDGHTWRDEEGTELAEVDEAKRAAIQMLGVRLADAPDELSDAGRYELKVTDEKGLVLFIVHAGVSLSPALMGRSGPTGHN